MAGGERSIRFCLHIPGPGDRAAPTQRLSQQKELLCSSLKVLSVRAKSPRGGSQNLGSIPSAALQVPVPAGTRAAPRCAVHGDSTAGPGGAQAPLLRPLPLLGSNPDTSWANTAHGRVLPQSPVPHTPVGVPRHAPRGLWDEPGLPGPTRCGSLSPVPDRGASLKFRSRSFPPDPSGGQRGRGSAAPAAPAAPAPCPVAAGMERGEWGEHLAPIPNPGAFPAHPHHHPQLSEA